MIINLSTETLNTLYNSLKCSEYTLKQQVKNNEGNKKEIAAYQLEEVKYALRIIEELTA